MFLFGMMTPQHVLYGHDDTERCVVQNVPGQSWVLGFVSKDVFATYFAYSERVLDDGRPE